MYIYLLMILAVAGSGYGDYNRGENSGENAYHHSSENGRHQSGENGHHQTGENEHHQSWEKGYHQSGENGYHQNRENGYHQSGGKRDHHARTNMRPDRSTIVHLFEWKWTDIADECERFLARKGYGGVQISPPAENAIIHLKDGSRPWFERYQPMSYILETRSGNEEQFLDMTRRCNKVGVRIFADVVVNHMTGDLPADTVGTAGSRADFRNYSYPAVPYTSEHFHRPHCGINDYNNADEVRKCELLGLKDLDHKQTYVRDKVTEYLNHLIDIGVAGFRVDAAKHMSPEDLKAIYSRLDDLNPSFGFRPNTKPYIYQEVIYYGDGAVKPTEYTSHGDVTEFRVGNELKAVFRGKNALKWLVNWGEEWSLSPSETALAFIDNHDTQRQSDVLTHKEDKAYKGAVAFMLAHPYGQPRVMSSYSFANPDQGPPMNTDESIKSPKINQDDTCGNGWVCEHRWRQIYQMVAFRNAVNGTNVTNWWDNDNNQIAFSRGNKGFIAFNLERSDLVKNLQTGLPPGTYCDVISGKREGDKCTGNTVTVREDGEADIIVPGNGQDMLLAIHLGKESSLQTPNTPYSENEQGDMPYDSSEYNRPYSSEHNNQPRGPPGYGRQPSGSQNYNQQPFGSPRRNRKISNNGDYNRQPNGSPGYNQQPNRSPGVNQQPNGQGYNGQPNGSPSYGRQPSGSSNYDRPPNRSPSYDRPPNRSQGRRRLPSGSPSGTPSYDWRRNLAPGSKQNGQPNSQNNDMQPNTPFGQPRHDRGSNRKRQPNSQNSDMQSDGPFGQPRHDRQNRSPQSRRESQNGSPSKSNNRDQNGSQGNKQFGSPGYQRGNNGSSYQSGGNKPHNEFGYQSQDSIKPFNESSAYQGNRKSNESANGIPRDQRKSYGSDSDGLYSNNTLNGSPNDTQNNRQKYGSRNDTSQKSQGNSNSPYSPNGSLNKNSNFGDRPSFDKYGNQSQRIRENGSANDFGSSNDGSNIRTPSSGFGSNRGTKSNGSQNGFGSSKDGSNRRTSSNGSQNGFGSSNDGSKRRTSSNRSQNGFGSSNDGSNRRTSSNKSPNDVSSARDTSETSSLLDHFKKFVKDVVSERG